MHKNEDPIIFLYEKKTEQLLKNNQNLEVLNSDKERVTNS